MTIGELRNVVVTLRAEHPGIVDEMIKRILTMTRGAPNTNVPVRIHHRNVYGIDR